jgi:hypothetical protein
MTKPHSKLNPQIPSILTLYNIKNVKAVLQHAKQVQLYVYPNSTTALEGNGCHRQALAVVPRGKHPVPTAQGARSALGPVFMDPENLVPPTRGSNRGPSGP